VLAAAGGLLVAFHPMFGFMGGAVNNDNGVNALAAITILLTVRALRRGVTVRSGVALGVAIALLGIMKATGFALYPLLALAGVGLLIKRHSRRDLIAYAATLASLVAVVVGWRVLSGLWEQPVATAAGAGGGGGGGATAGTTANIALDDPLGYLSYLWQVFLPPLPFMTDLFIFKWPFFDIYIERGWGAFGWYAVLFPRWVYGVILAVSVAVGALGVRAALRNRDWVKRHWLEVAFVVLVPVTVIAAVEAAYFSPSQRPVLPEFGRYLFPAITALSAIAVGSCLGLGRRWAPVGATALVAAVIVLDYASQLLTLAGFYT
jgi:4-amino-4-deoxy-L-arabinose transferase-like glycosyltransferase